MSAGIAAGAAAETAARDIGADIFRERHRFRQRRGNVCDAFARLRGPFAAVKITLLLRVKMIEGHRIPVAERRVVIARAGNVEIIRVEILRADGGFLVATRQRRRGQAAKQEEPDAVAAFHCSASVSPAWTRR